VQFEDKIVDATAMQLVLNPYQFDVLVMENMFGDILSDQIAGLVGGLGLAPGGNIGKDAAIFEPVHGSAPDIAGKGVANPGAMILAACMLLEHIGEQDKATRIRQALYKAVNGKKNTTPDLGGTGTTDSFADVIAELL
jgi:isocitrate dehydrogenase (NAD+)